MRKFLKSDRFLKPVRFFYANYNSMSLKKDLLKFLFLIIWKLAIFCIPFIALLYFVFKYFGEIYGTIIDVILCFAFMYFVEKYFDKPEKINKSAFLEVGKILFQKHENEFIAFYNSYLKEKNSTDRAIDILIEFAELKEIGLLIDWRGEENEFEIQEFISQQINKEISWKNADLLRGKHGDKDLNNGDFVIKLFKAIDKDLMSHELKLLFLDTGGDSYYLMIVKNNIYQEIIAKKLNDFHGVSKLK